MALLVSSSVTVVEALVNVPGPFQVELVITTVDPAVE